MRLGSDLTVIGNEPDGRNINLECGSTHPERLAALVLSERLRMGVAFDGDGDRAIFVDSEGLIVDGDAVLLLCARHMRSQGRLKGKAVVATVMSNIGLEMALRESRIELVRPVGDKYVMEEMLKRDRRSAESSRVTSSFPIISSPAMALRRRSACCACWQTRAASWPSWRRSSSRSTGAGRRSGTRETRICGTSPKIAGAMNSVEQRLAGQGRLLVRYSGTEPLLRVMIEGKDRQEIQGGARDRRQRQRAPGMTSPDATGPRLSVNVNKIATLRNSRGGSVPSVVQGVSVCVAAGATGITVHPRADARHITTTDVHAIATYLAPRRRTVEYNMEGDPRPDFLALVRDVRPHQCTLVPVKPGEITSQAGWPADTPTADMREIVGDLRERGVRVSIFVDPDRAAIEWAASVGGDRVELYTEPFAHAFKESAEATDRSSCGYIEAAASRTRWIRGERGA